MITLLTGNSAERLKELEDNSIDALVTDPPYLINFMGKNWDKEDSPAGDSSFWEEVLRVMKPGAHGLVFGHSRQHHRVMTALEDAGFEIRDCLMWLYGSGFPKSHNVALGIDKSLGHKNRGRAIPTASSYQASDKERKNKLTSNKVESYKSREEKSKEWEGWGTALKPAYEPIIMVRKPLAKKHTIAKNVLAYGVGGINIDASRIGEGTGRFPANVLLSHHPDCKVVGENTETIIGGNKGKSGFVGGYESGDFTKTESTYPVYQCDDDCAVKILDEQAPKTGNGHAPKTKITGFGKNYGGTTTYEGAGKRLDGLSGASRFFYCAKVGKKERNAGDVRNTHPTVKPIKLMTYLTKLITPPNGKVLDPFMGSGSTGMACALEGFDFVGIDMEEEYIEISAARIEWALEQVKEEQ